MDTLIKKTRTRLSPEKRKQQLLDFALEVFARRGIGRAGHADIAEMANVSVATVFNYFPTREDLVEQVLLQVNSHFDEILELCLAGAEFSLRASIETLTHRLIDAVLEQREWLKVWFEWSTSVREEVWPSYVSSSNATQEKMVKAFSQAVARGEIKQDDIPTFTSLLHGVCYVLYLEANRNPDREQLIDSANRYLAVICPNSETA